MGQKYNSAITFTSGATKLSKSLLPLVNTPRLSTCWSTPTPVHIGDLAFDPNSLITNGDYWYNFYIALQSRGDYYVQALGFYITAYNSPLVTVVDKTTVSQKILSSYNKLLDEADALALEDKDTSCANAAKYYWIVLQGPSLDPKITDRARIGYQSALARAIL